jgi:DNA-binding PadR family transcriptional regulator
VDAVRRRLETEHSTKTAEAEEEPRYSLTPAGSAALAQWRWEKERRETSSRRALAGAAC